VVFGSKAAQISAAALTDSKALIAYADNSNSDYGTAVVLTISGTTITTGTAVVFDYNFPKNISFVTFSATSAIVVYYNGTGAFANLSINGTTITTDATEIGTYVQPATSRLHNVGVAKTGGTEGQTVDVYCVGSPTNLISFTIDGTSYQAAEGMTWGEWVASEYNTGGIRIGESGSVYLEFSIVHYSFEDGEHAVPHSDTIIENYDYDTSHVGGSN
jgi:hypothetical protein